MDYEEMRGKVKKYMIWGLAVFVVLFLGFLLLTSGAPASGQELYSPQPTPTAQMMYNVFTDINGDGKIDLLTKGEVIFNVSP